MHLKRARVLALPLVAALVASSARPVWSADEKQACVDAAESAQDLRSAARLRDAREKLLVCARDVCPPVVRKDCQQWLKDVDASLPTVVFRATKDGADVVDVKVFLDDALLLPKLAGNAVAVDPGQHTFRFEMEGAAPVTRTVVIHEAEKNRAIDVSFAGEGGGTAICEVNPAACTQPRPVEKPAPVTIVDRSEPPGMPAGTIVLGAVGVVALGAFAVLGITGKNDVSHLRSTCAPSCDQGDVDAAKRKLLFADVSLAVGVVALGAATWIFLARRDAEPSPASGALHLDVGATPRGGFAGISGAF